jgi:uncharacterized C2H2 Zn-finger protein
MEIIKNDESKIKYICPNCLKNFKNKKSDYIRHINKKISCVSDVNKKMEEMNNYIIKLKKENEKLIQEDEKIIQEDKKLKEEIIKLKEENEILKNQVIIYNNTPTKTINNYINVIQINNFNDTDYKGNFNNLLNEIGKSIYLKTIKNVFLNPEKPENNNIYIADKSRGLVKVYNNGLWETKNMNIIDEIINNVIKYFNLSIEEIKEDIEKYEKLKKTISKKINYIQLCDLEYLEDLEDDVEENKERIERCHEFRKMVYNEIITLFHDNKKIVLDTHKRHKINIIKALYKS